MKIAFNSTETNFIKTGGSKLTHARESYYYFPFWMKEVNGGFEKINFEDLPTGVIKKIREMRGDRNPKIDKQTALEYEVGSTGLVASFFYSLFPKLLSIRFERRYKRYLEYNELKKKYIKEN